MRIKKIIGLAILPLLLLTSCDNKLINSSSGNTSTGSTSEATSNSSVSSIDKNLPSSITIYSLNDVHGAIEYENGSSKTGMSRMFQAIKKDSDYDEETSFIISAGDMFQGSALSNLSEGKAMIEIMNEMNFKAMAVGNHEFDWGVEKLSTLASLANFPFLGINIYSRSTNDRVDFVEDSTIVDVKGAKVGIVGTIYSGAASSISANMIKDIEFKSDVELAIAEGRRLKEEEKCDLVILDTHQGDSTSVDKILESGYFDAGFGGHDHSSGTSKVGSVPFVKGRANTEAYSKVKFTLSGGNYNSRANYVNSTSSNNSRLATTPKIEEIISKYQTEIGPILEEKLSYAEYDFNKDAVGSLVCYSLYNYGKQYEDVVASYHNKSGIRSYFSAGDITYKDIYACSPFDNEVRLVEIDGRDVYGKATGYYSYISIPRNEVDNSKTYKVVVFDYIITNGSFGIYEDTEKMINNEVKVVRETVVDYLKTVDSISPSMFESVN